MATRYAFLKDDDPAYAPKIMAVIVQQNGPAGSPGKVIDAHLCADKAELDGYLNEWLGVDRPVQPVYTKTNN